MLAGGFLPIATFMAPALAGLCLIPVAHETGNKTGVLAYLAVSILSFFIVPDREMAMFFVFILGYYPLLLPRLCKIKPIILRIMLKLVLFNGAIFIIYTLLRLVFISPGLMDEMAEYTRMYWIGLLLLGNITFLLYDNLGCKMWLIYLHHLRKRFFR